MLTCPCSQHPRPQSFCQWSKPREWETLNISEVPSQPGFYVFTNYPDEPLRPSTSEAKVLYVGETANLLHRMKDYKIQGRSALGHRGATHLLSSHLDAVSASGAGENFVLERHRQSSPTVVYRKGQAPKTLDRPALYVRWAVDRRQAIEELLIRELNPSFNSVHALRKHF